MNKNYEQIYDAIRLAERFFRLGMEAAGSDTLIQLVDALQPLLAECSPSDLTELNPILSRIISCQERKDWIQAADLIHFELAPYLHDLLLALIDDSFPLQ